MSRTIDERVVSMQFDNRQFESNVRTSLGTLDKLKQSLNLKGASDGLDRVRTAAQKCDFSPLGKAVDTVKIKFSALEVMAVTAISNITNSAVNAGKRITKALTIDPVKTGLSEYETQINAVQTILANTQSKGTTLDQVNAALDELNRYADMTIYNFTEMTRNIGTFTAAGVDLETSVAAIKGIANLAAVSGSTSQQAATAMYQLSQALSSGTVKLMDWNSVVNAGMGGQVFQDALKETARVHGIAIDAMIKKNGSFRETLQEGWLTSEILLETLQKFTGDLSEEQLKSMGYTEAQIKEIIKLGETANDAATKVKTFTQLMDTLKEAVQSGWAQSWELIIGDFEQAKELWTGVSDVLNEIIGKSADKRNNILYGALSSNWDKMVDKINEAGISTEKFEESVIKTARDSGYPIDYLIKKYGNLEDAIRKGGLPTKLLAKALDDVVASAADLTIINKELKKGVRGDEVKEMQQALSDLGYDLSKFGVDGIFGSETQAALKAFQEAKGLEVTGILDDATLEALKDATKGISGLTDEISELISGVDELGGRELLIKSFKNIWGSLKKVFNSAAVAWHGVFEPKSTEQKAAGLYSLIEKFHAFTESLKLSDESAGKFIRIFKGLFAILNIGKTIVGGGLTFAFRTLNAILKHFDLNILDVAASVGDALVKFQDWLLEDNRLIRGFDKLVGWTVKSAGAVRNWIKEFIALPEVQEKLDGIKDFFSGGWKRIKDFGSRLGSFVKYFMFDENGNLNIEGIKKMFRDFKTSVVDYFTNIDFTKIKDNVKSFFGTIRDFFSSKFASIGGGNNVFKKIKTVFVTIGDFFKDKIKNFSIGGFFEGIKNIFTNLWSAVTKFLTPVGEKLGVTGEKIKEFKDKIVNFFKIVGEKINDNKGSIIALVSLAGIIALIIKVKNIITKLMNPFETLIESFSNVADSFAELNKAKAKVEKAKAGKIRSQAIKNIAASILIVAGALYVISKIPREVLWRSVGVLGAIAGVLVLIPLLLKLFDKIKTNGATDFRAIGDMMAKLGIALILVAAAIKILSGLETGQLVQGGIAVGVFFGLVIAMMAVSKKMNAKDVAEFGKMVRKISVSLLLLALVVKILGGMETKTLIQGGIAVAAFLGIFSAMIRKSDYISKDADKFGKMIRNISVSLLLLAVAVAVFGKMKTKTLVQGGLAVSAFLGIIVGVMKLTKSISGDVASFGKMMFGISAGLLLMAFAVKILGGLDTDVLIKGGMAVLGFVGIVALLMKATTLMGKYSFNAGKMGLLVMSFATSILIITGAIAALSMIDAKDLTKALATIAGVGLIFAGLLLATKFAKNVDFKTLIALSASVAIIAGAIIALSFIETKDLVKATAAIGSMVGVFSLLIYTCKSIEKMKFGKTLLVLGTLLIVVGALGFIILTLTDQVKDADKAVKVAAAMSALIVALSVSAALLAKASNCGPKSWKGVGMLLALAGGIALIAGAVIGIALWQLPNIAEQLSSFMTKLMPFIDGAKSIDSNLLNCLKTLGEAILLFTSSGALYAIANIATFGGVSRSFNAFISFIKAIMPEITELAKSVAGEHIDFKNFEAIVGAIKGFAEAAAAIPNTTIAAFGSKWGGGAVVSIPNVKAFGKFIKEAVPVVKDVALAVSGSGVSFNESRLTAVVNAIKSLAEAADLVPDTTITAAFGKFGKGFGGSVTYSKSNFSGFAEFISAATGAVTTFIDSLSTEVTDGDGTKKVQKFTDEDLEYVGPICEAIKVLAEAAALVPESTVAAFGGGGLFKKFQGFGIAGGGGTYSSSADLVGFANFIGDAFTAVTTFMDNFFYDGNGNKIQKFTTNDLEMVRTLCESLGLIGQAVEFVPSYVTGTFGGGGIGGSWLMKGLSGGGGSGEFSVAPMLTEFTTWISSTLTAMADFSTSLKGSETQAAVTKTDAETVKSLCEAVGAIGGAMEFVPSRTDFEASFTAAFGGAGMGGVVGGSASGSIVPMLEEFQSWISGVAGVLPGFATAVSDAKLSQTDLDNISSLCSSVTTLAEAASLAPTYKEYGSWILGDFIESTDLEGFTNWITSVVPLVAQIASGTLTDADGNTISLENVDTTKLNVLTDIAEAAKKVAEAAKLAPQKTEYEGLLLSITESTDIEGTVNWFKDVYELITGLISDISTNSIDTTALTTLQSVADVASTLSGAIWNVAMSLNTKSVDAESFTQAAIALGAFCTYIADLVDNENFDIELVSKAATAVNNLAFAIDKLSVIDFSVFTEEWSSTLTTTLGSIASAMSGFETSMDGVDVTDEVSQIASLAGLVSGLSAMDFTGTSSFETALTELATISIGDVATAFEDGSDTVVTAAVSMLEKAASGMKTTTVFDSFVEVGAYVVSGFCKGIDENTYKAEAQAKAMAQAAEEAARNELAINSPSKVFEWIGSGVPEGFVNGIGSMGSAVKNSSISMARIAIDGTKNAISRIADLINTDIDAQPTIRPVLDLSDVRAGAGSISSMFGSPSVGLSANVGSISRMMNNRQNGTNSDVVSAIHNLEKKLGTSTGDTININGITYDDGSNIANAMRDIVRAARVERRV